MTSTNLASRSQGVLTISLALIALHSFSRAPEIMASQGEPTSRWLPTSGEYRLAAEYGSRERDWLEGVAAVDVAATGEVVVYDAASARLVILSPDLRLIREFAREGPGPGELQRLSIYRANPPRKQLLSTAGSELALYDGVTVHVFSVTGSFQAVVPGFPRGSVSYWSLIGISHAPDGLLYALDTRGRPNRELQTWRVSDGNTRLLFSLPLAPLPPAGESHQQARPQWAVSGDHVFAGDGENDFVLRYSMATARTDTFPLPGHGHRSPRTVEDAQLPRLPSGEERPAPRHTAEWRWANLVVDPDGFLWIAPRDRDERRSLKTVHVVDPQSGRKWRLEVPAYPWSFGAPGVYYSAEAPAPDLIHVVRKYQIIE